ncbi:MAG: prenyltransferase/squalene oxidase repeat-containing protein [Phycisphaeraceae bacterium]
MVIGLVCPAPCAAQAQRESEALLPDPEQMARVEASVDRALEYLLTQQKADGSWPSGFGGDGSNNGVNALCLLAYLGRGHAPGRGPYREVVDRAVRYLLATQEDNGLFKSPNNSHGPMYEHALATLALIEAYGFSPSQDMRGHVQRAVDLIVKSQNPKGGWRYQPVPKDADLSVTVMQVVALRAAINARLDVPEQTMQQALSYVKACAVDKGGFAYQPGGGPGPARTAAGILSMYLLGAFDDPAVGESLAWMQQRGFRPGGGHFWYMNYYAMQAMFQAGGEHWSGWQREVRAFLLDKQNGDGSWPAVIDRVKQYNGKSRCYSTAMAAISLEVYMHYLPAYQR